MTRAQLQKLVRSLIEERGTDWLGTSGTSDALLVVDDYLNMALDRYAVETKCFPVSYTKAATAGTASYLFSVFGTASAGLRIFEPTFVSYDSTELTPITIARLNNSVRNWRSSSNGTPRYWFIYGNGIRLYPAPDSTKNIVLEGYETYNSASWTTGEPPISTIDHELIAIMAAILAMQRDPGEENQIRSSYLYPRWQEGINAAKQRMHGSGQAKVVYARQAGYQGGSSSLVTDSVIDRADPAGI